LARQGNNSTKSNRMKRIVPGLLIAGGWLLLLLKGSTFLFCLVILPIVFLAAHEYLKMVDKRDISLFERMFLSFLPVLPVIFVCLNSDIQWLPLSFMVSFFAVTCYFLYRYKDIKENYNLFCRFAAYICTRQLKMESGGANFL
jgi:CDP-diglyceride synthetase